MDPAFWHTRWQDKQIGFHQKQTNKLLMKHWSSVCPDPSANVFVPLCGKSLDMMWLAERGHRVIGVELSEVACAEFFKEQGLEPGVTTDGPFKVLRHGRIEILCGDFFKVSAERLKSVCAAFDRASLIALPADLRRRYAEHLSTILHPTARTLLLTITYDQSEMTGPPFSVSTDEVEELFAPGRSVEHRETRDALAGSKNLQNRGVTSLTTSVFVIGSAVTGDGA